MIGDLPIPERAIGQVVIESPAAPSALHDGAILWKVASPPARPGHFAEREELDAAIITNTAAAFELFIERHPESRYRAEAEDRLRALRNNPSRP